MIRLKNDILAMFFWTTNVGSLLVLIYISDMWTFRLFLMLFSLHVESWHFYSGQAGRSFRCKPQKDMQVFWTLGENTRSFALWEFIWYRSERFWLCWQHQRRKKTDSKSEADFCCQPNWWDGRRCDICPQPVYFFQKLPTNEIVCFPLNSLNFAVLFAKPIVFDAAIISWNKLSRLTMPICICL